MSRNPQAKQMEAISAAAREGQALAEILRHLAIVATDAGRGFSVGAGLSLAARLDGAMDRIDAAPGTIRRAGRRATP